MLKQMGGGAGGPGGDAGPSGEGEEEDSDDDDFDVLFNGRVPNTCRGISPAQGPSDSSSEDDDGPAHARPHRNACHFEADAARVIT